MSTVCCSMSVHYVLQNVCVCSVLKHECFHSVLLNVCDHSVLQYVYVYCTVTVCFNSPTAAFRTLKWPFVQEMRLLDSAKPKTLKEPRKTNLRQYFALLLDLIALTS